MAHHIDSAKRINADGMHGKPDFEEEGLLKKRRARVRVAGQGRKDEVVYGLERQETQEK